MDHAFVGADEESTVRRSQMNQAVEARFICEPFRAHPGKVIECVDFIARQAIGMAERIACAQRGRLVRLAFSS